MELETDFSVADYAYFSQQFEQKGQQSQLIQNPNTAFFAQQIDDTAFQSIESSFLYPITVQAYTPSYGSPQSTFYDSSSSISDYEPSDGYSSCSSPGLASPNIQADFPIDDDQRDSLQFDEDLQQQYAAEAYNFEFQLQQDPPFAIEQEIKMENHPFASLKLDTNISNLDDDSHPNDGSTDFMSISPNTLAQCLQVDQPPLFSFIPATPITPTKAQAIADNSLYGYPINPAQPISIDHHKQAQSGSTTASSVNPESISKSVITSDTNSPATNTANVNNKASNSRRPSSPSTSSTQSHHNRNSNTAVSAPTTTPTHHRSHRKALPQDMAERLHTMNLAPPKPQRKSKTSAPFTCPYDDCPKTFTRQYNLKSHLRTHTDERPFLCGYQGCTRAFARQHDRKRHYNLHLGFKPHVCSHCGRAFARLDALNRHLRSDSGAPCAQATLPNGGAKKFKAVNM